MRLLIFSALLAAAFAGVLHLHGESSMIRFADDAILTASCMDPPATVKYLSVPGREDLSANAGQSITAYVSNVKSSCADVRSIKQPCASSTSDGMNYPPLFYCLWSAGAQSVAESGPVSAYRTEVRATNAELMGFTVAVSCPLPDQSAVSTVTGANPVTLGLSIAHYAPSGSSANFFAFSGVSGGNVLTVTYGPVPPSAPSPPPTAVPVSSPTTTPSPTPTPSPAPAPSPSPVSTNFPVYPWTFQAADYENSATVTAAIQIAGVNQASGTLAAAVGNTVRGVAQPSVNPAAPVFGQWAGESVYQIVVGANDPGETISYLFFDGCETTVLTETYTFNPNDNIGNAQNPTILSAPSAPPCANPVSSPPPPDVSPPPSPSPAPPPLALALEFPPYPWTFVASDYENSATITAAVTIDGAIMSTGSLAALVATDNGGEVRGVGTPTLNPNIGVFGQWAGQGVFQFVIGSNSVGDVISYVYNDGTAGYTSVIMDQTYTFNPNDNMGSASNPVSLTATSRRRRA